MLFTDFSLLLLEDSDFRINCVSRVMGMPGFTCRYALFLLTMGSEYCDRSNSWCQVIKAASLEFVNVLFLFYPFVYTQIKTWSPMAEACNWIKCSEAATELWSNAWVTSEQSQHLKNKFSPWSFTTALNFFFFKCWEDTIKVRLFNEQRNVARHYAAYCRKERFFTMTCRSGGGGYFP